MATAQLKAMLDAAHAPAARAKAMKTLLHLTALRRKLAEKHGIAASYFTKGHLLGTVRRLNIPLHTIPEELFHPFPRPQRMELLAERKRSKTNGAGSSIPLHAIPDRKKRELNGDRAPYGSKGFSKKGHPNAAQIDKVLDLLADPKTTQKMGERLLAALEKLMT